jgi:hypothetical protein
MPGTLVLMLALCGVLDATGERGPVHSIQAAYAAGRISKAEARDLWKSVILHSSGGKTKSASQCRNTGGPHCKQPK